MGKNRKNTNGALANKQTGQGKPTYEQLLAENADLKRQLERAQIMLEVLTGGLPGRVDAAIEQMQIERDMMRDYLQRGEILLYDTATELQNKAVSAHLALKATLDQLGEVEQQQGLSEVVSRLAGTYTVVMEPELNTRGRDIAAQRETMWTSQEYYENFQAHIEYIKSCAESVGIDTVASDLFSIAYNLSGDVRFVCHQIMHELETSHRVKLETLERLNTQWVETHLDAQRLTTIQDGLRKYHIFNRSGDTLDDYEAATGIPKRTLVKYGRWWKTVKQWAEMPVSKP